MIKVHAGDFSKGEGVYSGVSLLLPTKENPKSKETIHESELQEIDVASEETVKRVGGALGWGAVGAIALGPVGLLAGLLLGGKGKDVTFVAKFKDGRKLLATTDSKTFTKLKAVVF